MAFVVLQQVSSSYAKSNAGKTLDKPIALKYLERYVDAVKFEQLQKNFPEESLYLWGAKFERHHPIP